MRSYKEEIEAARSSAGLGRRRLKHDSDERDMVAEAGDRLRDAAAEGLPANEVRYRLGMAQARIRLALKATRGDLATFHLTNALVGIGRAEYALELSEAYGTMVVIEGVTV